MIRVGEKILQKVGAKLPMVWGGIITTIGVAMMGLTFLPGFTYTVVVFIGFALFGLGLGFMQHLLQIHLYQMRLLTKSGKQLGFIKWRAH